MKKMMMGLVLFMSVMASAQEVINFKEAAQTTSLESGFKLPGLMMESERSSHKMSKDEVAFYLSQSPDRYRIASVIQNYLARMDVQIRVNQVSKLVENKYIHVVIEPRTPGSIEFWYLNIRASASPSSLIEDIDAESEQYASLKLRVGSKRSDGELNTLLDSLLDQAFNQAQLNINAKKAANNF